MKLETIKGIRRPQDTIVECDSWDVNAYEDQLQEAEELGSLLERGLSKIPTAYGLLLDLFTLLFTGEPKLKGRLSPCLMLQAMVIETIWALPELQRLRIHTQYRRNEVTACILRFGQAILDAIPPQMSQLAQQIGQGQGEEPKGQSSGEESPVEQGEDNEESCQSQEGQEGQEGQKEERSCRGESSESSDETESRQSSPGSGQGNQGNGGASQKGEGNSSHGMSQKDTAREEATQALEEALRRMRPSLTQTLKAEVNKASKDVKDIQDICSSQGWDLSSPELGNEEGDKAWEACRKLLQSQELREIFRKFGNRFRTLAMASQEQKPVGKGFVSIDRTVGDDIYAIPPDETYLLTEPKLEALAVQALAEGTMVQEDYQEEFEREQGDIVALMDISGSTRGVVSQFIKGIILGLQVIAQAQSRRLVVIPFYDKPLTALDMTNPSMKDLLKLSEMRAGGGTDFEAALKAAIETVQSGANPDDPPDIVMITDGECPIPNDVYGKTATDQRVWLKTTLESLGTRLKVVYIGVSKESLYYRDVGEIAGPGNEIFLRDISDWKNLSQVYEQI